MAVRNTTGHTVFHPVRRLLTVVAGWLASVRGQPADRPNDPPATPAQFASAYVAKPTDARIGVSLAIPGRPVILIGAEGKPDRDAALVRWCAALFGRAVWLRIVHVLTIPMTGPLDVPLPHVEDDAKHKLAQVARIAEIRGINVETSVLRHRKTISGLAEEARRTGATVVVVRDRGIAAPWAHYLLDRSIRRVWAGCPCAVITVHLSEPRPIVRIPRASRTKRCADMSDTRT